MTAEKRRRTPLIALLIALPLILAFALTDLKYLPEYLAAVLRKCPEEYQGAALKQPFLVIGHRGAAGVEVENTLPSMRRAVEIDSANGLEIDLCMTKDSVIVLWHDWDPDSPISEARELGLETDVKYRPLYPLEGTPERRLVHTLTLAELRQHYGYTLKEPLDADERKRVPATIPTLDEFLALVSRYDRLRIVYLDLKIPEEQSALTGVYIDRIRKSLDAVRPHYNYVFITPHEKILGQLEQMNLGDNISFDVEPPAGLVLKPWEEELGPYGDPDGERVREHRASQGIDMGAMDDPNQADQERRNDARRAQQQQAGTACPRRDRGDDQRSGQDALPDRHRSRRPDRRQSSRAATGGTADGKGGGVAREKRF